MTKIAEANGFLPMLYTDADYVASNACYEKKATSFAASLALSAERTKTEWYSYRRLLKITTKMFWLFA